MIDDEVLKITSEQIRDGEVYTEVYNVADLVIPIPNFVPSSNVGLQGLINDAYAALPQNVRNYGPGPVSYLPQAGPAPRAEPLRRSTPNGVLPQQFGAPAGGSSVDYGSGPSGLGGAANADFDSLIDLIVSTVEHDSWMENGTGDGEIQPFPTNLSLVISQTQRVHEQIADLLEQLRRLNRICRLRLKYGSFVSPTVSSSGSASTSTSTSKTAQGSSKPTWRMSHFPTLLPRPSAWLVFLGPRNGNAVIRLATSRRSGHTLPKLKFRSH